MKDAVEVRRAVNLALGRMNDGCRAPKEPNVRQFLEGGYDGCPLDRWARQRVTLMGLHEQREKRDGRMCRSCGRLFPLRDTRVHYCPRCRKVR